MPYVVGTYRDKIGAMDCLLSGTAESLAECNRAIAWQRSGGTTGRRCNDSAAGEHDMRTEWHIADPAPDSPFSMVCRVCGRELTITRGAFTWEAFHEMARKTWGEAISPNVAEFRLSVGGL